MSLVGCWPLSLATHTPDFTMHDVSGEGNDGTSANVPVWANDQQGVANEAMVFNGTSDYISIGDLSEAEDRIFTYSVWIKTVQSGGDRWIVAEGSSISIAPIIGIINNDGIARVYFRTDASASIDIRGTITINDGVWHHIVATGDGTTLVLYVDRVEDSSGSFPSGATSLNTCGIGALIRASVGQFMNGSLSRVRISNHTLLQPEITNLYTIELAGILSQGLSGTLLSVGDLSTVLTIVKALNGELDLSGTLRGINPAWLVLDDILTWQGEWSITWSYDLNDVVLYKFGDEWHVFVSKISHNVGNIPTSTAEAWHRLYQEQYL